ncbi:hypothetical protein GXP70_07105 [Paenibacillus lycopersici]|uniref:DNA mismatch repair proteins mutS family domain-containing protein n=1 Tax=Paenibacillus lycopersici TaxID=2704462 RepID=A0A6C0FWA8_9BACL|nr:hypothetical protein [Paenibacillus lycopersici]QHT59743.1 hypothetical protein GXP70_07105 [Paenibacillus lycopersici]
MPVQLCNTNQPVRISREALIDLDVLRLCRSLFPEKSTTHEDKDRAIEAFLNAYLTSDAIEIGRRSEIIGCLRDNAESRMLIAQLIKENQRLSYNLSELDRSKQPLKIYTCMRHALEAYTASVLAAESLFAPRAPAMEEIAAVIRLQSESSFYLDVQTCLRQLGTIIQPLDNIKLAVNMSDLGQAVQIGVTDINKGAGRLTGLFGSATDNANSLCDAAPVKNRGHLAQLEGYIIAQVEKQWAAPLKSALRELKKIDRDRLRAWNEWLKPMELYQKGLALADKLAQARVDVCRPEPCADIMAAEGLLYPHMVLTERTPVQQAFRVSLGDTVMITGANSSGKSSILKALAQNCILAQLGFWIPAKSMRIIPFQQYCTVFAAGEDRHLNASRYQQEAENMHQAIHMAGPGTLLLFNEPFTSTNPVEASELLSDITAQLHEAGTTLMMVTHLYNVYDLLRQRGLNVRSYTMGSRLGAETIEHTYAVEEKAPDGLSYARLLAIEYGFRIANLVDDPDKAAVLEDFMMRGGGDIA